VAGVVWLFDFASLLWYGYINVFGMQSLIIWPLTSIFQALIVFATLLAVRRCGYRLSTTGIGATEHLSHSDPRGQDRFWDGADLALEAVSEDKPERDLVDKQGDYAEARVPKYRIVNPRTETSTVLRLSGDVYEEAGTYRRGQWAASVERPEFSVVVDDVFDAAR
jgi:hypothetical protein